MGRRVYFTIVCCAAVCAKLRVSRTPRPARGRLSLRAPRAARCLMSDDRCRSVVDVVYTNGFYFRERNKPENQNDRNTTTTLLYPVYHTHKGLCAEAAAP